MDTKYVELSGRQWLYQTCTEFGYYQSSELVRQPFGRRFPVEFSVRQCGDIFGARFSADLLRDAVRRTNTLYGALKLRLERVVFPNGSIDPWHALGITTNGTGNAAVYIQGARRFFPKFSPFHLCHLNVNT